MAHAGGAVSDLVLRVGKGRMTRSHVVVEPLSEQEFQTFYAATARPLRAYIRSCVGDPTLADPTTAALKNSSDKRLVPLMALTSS